MRTAREALLETWAIGERANQVLLRHVAHSAWRAPLPDGSGEKTIASIFAHLHNARLMWLKLTGRRTGLPPRLDRRRCTKREASVALGRSARELSRHLAAALEREDLRMPGFPPHAVAFACYLLAHDAHHRGQVLLLSRQLGHRLPPDARYGVWHWSRLARAARGGRPGR